MIYTLFAKAQLIHEIDVTISPTVFGAGISLFSEGLSMDLRLMEMRRLDDQVVNLRYRVL